MPGTMATEPMAAKKSSKPGKPAAEPKPARKPMIVQIRGSEEYKAWVDAMAESEGFSVAMLFDRAVRVWAKEHGHPDAPKR